MAFANRNRRCPICGRSDYCTIDVGPAKCGIDVTWYGCYRATEPTKLAQAGTSVTGGRAYTTHGVYVQMGEPRNTAIGWKVSFVSEEDEQRIQEEGRRQWCLAKGINYKRGQKKSPAEVERLKQEAERRKAEYVATDEQPETPVADLQIVDRFFRGLLNALVLEEPDRQLLVRKERWGDELFKNIVSKYPIRSMPPTDKARKNSYSKLYSEYSKLTNIGRGEALRKALAEVGTIPEGEGIPGLYHNEEGKWELNSNVGYILPQFNIEGLIFGLRIRIYDAVRKNTAEWMFKKMPKEEKQKRMIKYHTADVSICIQQMAKKEVAKYNYIASKSCNGTGAVLGISVYGLKYLERYRSGEQTRAITCEGEKKAMVASEKYGCLVLALPGVGMYRLLKEPCIVSGNWKGKVPTMLEWLRSVGVKRIAVANDSDMWTNQNVKNATGSTMRLVMEHGFATEFARWSPDCGKGLDDCLLNGFRPEFVRVNK